MDPARRSRVLGWWYLAIAVGFLLLGANRLLMHDRLGFALRLLIASGFLFLGFLELRRK